MKIISSIHSFLSFEGLINRKAIPPHSPLPPSPPPLPEREKPDHRNRERRHRYIRARRHENRKQRYGPFIFRSRVTKYEGRWRMTILAVGRYNTTMSIHPPSEFLTYPPYFLSNFPGRFLFFIHTDVSIYHNVHQSS